LNRIETTNRMSMVMTRQRLGNLLKGFAWLSLAAAALPALTTADEPSVPATRLTVGLPWSPWLVYRESWVQPQSASGTTPALSCETTIESRSDSTFVLLAGGTLLLLSWLLKAPRSRRSDFNVQPSAFNRSVSGLRR
jgi:hypothetical protein